MHAIDANGARLPALGFGTWTLGGEPARAMVEAALTAGFRHLDTAQMYGNEVEVGRGLAATGVPRDEVFLTTKVWPDDHAPARLLAAAETSCDRLATVPDLLLLHWPSHEVPIEDTVEALGTVMERGLARHVGVSNFTTRLLREALRPGVRLACNQVEYHPFLAQDAVLAATRAAGMALVAYCPLARGRVAASAVIGAIAARHGASPEQIALAWLVNQAGVAAIPRTSNPKRLAANLAAAELRLTPDEMAAIHALGREGYRICDFDFAPAWDPA
ncbi:MAG: aldo/keto reductase [Alphaproteobacteria bacterium]